MDKIAKTMAFICPTTHWDREWIMTFGQYRVRLVKLIDNLLSILDKYDQYTFYLDGQAAVLDDYFEIKPENRDKISKYLQSGRLSAGPWYVLADQFLQGGEATIRNLVLGMETVKKYGGEPAMIGYVPDSFGSIASLPMILSGFGIDAATFGRGRPHWGDGLPHTEFIWKSADNSEVIAVNHGYGNGLFLGYNDIWTDIFAKEAFIPNQKQVLEIFMQAARHQEKNAALPALYFSVGVDHMEPREMLVHNVDYINKNQNRYELVFGTPADYLGYIAKDPKKLQTLKTYAGELRGSYKERVFEGTFTSRIYTKQLNDKCEILLSGELEPLFVFASLFAGVEYPRGHLSDLWKQHILNHPHDSICGCNLDQVDRDMKNRCGYVIETGEYLRKEAIDALVENIDTSYMSDMSDSGQNSAAVVVFNPLGHKRGGRAHGLVRIPKRFDFGAYALHDENGAYVPAKIRHVADKKKDLESVYMTPEMLARVISKTADENVADDMVFSVLEIDFAASDIPSMGYKTYHLSPADMPGSFSPAVAVTKNGMENEHIKVEFNGNATFDITDKKSGRRYKNLNYFADREEAGNSYLHHEFKTPEQYDTKNIMAGWELEENSGHRAVFKTSFDFMLPEKIENGRRSHIKKPVNITVKAELGDGLDYLGIKIEMDNTCLDHCFRAVFELDIEGGQSFAFDHYSIAKREPDSGELEWRGNPFSEFAGITNDADTFCISTKGLPAYEAIDCDGGVRLYIELLRACGEVGYPAGANYPASGLQCTGAHTFEYAVFPGGDTPAKCLEKGANYRRDLLVAGGGVHTGALPSSTSFISIECECENGPKPYISCLKQSESGGEIILRLWNPGETQKIGIGGLAKPREVWTTTLDERKTGRVSPDEIVLPAQGLTTLALVF